MITNGSASVISNNLYDLFGVLRYEQGSAQTPWRDAFFRQTDEGFYLLENGKVAVEISKFRRGWREFCKKVKQFAEECGSEIVQKCHELKEKCDVLKPVYDCTQCTRLAIEAGRECNRWLDTEEGFEWCLNHPKCAGNGNCCRIQCANEWLRRNGGLQWLECIHRCVDVVKKSWEVVGR